MKIMKMIISDAQFSDLPPLSKNSFFLNVAYCTQKVWFTKGEINVRLLAIFVRIELNMCNKQNKKYQNHSQRNRSKS